ncbi:MAG: hypothetical protein HYV63_30410 [Candidatus Schekmanbacteria bacterium]|nr:hypothetical protein [Candidatus Schekmanbacteria bacterium]
MRKCPIMLNSDLPSIRSGIMPYGDNDDLNRAYGHFHSLANAGGRSMAFCSSYDFAGDGTVSGYWVPRNWRWAPVAEPIEATFVFDKLDEGEPHFRAVIDRIIELGLPIFGHVGLSRLVGSKWKSYEAFRRYHALTRRIDPASGPVEEQVSAFFDLMDETYAEHHEAALLKPDHGWESRGIFMVTRQPRGLELRHWWGQRIDDPGFVRHILGQLARLPYVIQTLVHTYEGIPEIGLAGLRHDARFVFAIKDHGRVSFIQTYVKTVDHGMIYVHPDSYPAGAWAVVDPVAHRIGELFPYGVFSVDVMRDISGRWFLTELNDQVGFNINWHQQGDFEGVDQLMKAYLEEMHEMMDNPAQPRYRSPL